MFKKIFTYVALAAAVFTATAAPVVTSGSLTLGSFEHAGAPGGTVFGYGSPVSAGLGALSASFDDGFGAQSFLVYCVDLFSAAGAFGTGYQYDKIDFVQGDFAAALEPANITALSKLFTFNGGASNTNAASSAGMQLAVWELLYDGEGGSLSTGNFKAGSAPAASVLWANTLLAGAATTTAGYKISLFADEAYSFKPTHQNYITATANFGDSCGVGNNEICSTVPEPTSLALTMAGLVGIAVAKRKKFVR